MKVIQTDELHVKTANKVGALSEILGVAGKAGVNILGYAAYVQGGKGHVHLVTENNAAVTRSLKKAGYAVGRRPVVVVRSRDVVGRGGSLAQRIAKAGINLSTAYATAAGGRYITVYEARDQRKLAKALK